VLNGDELLVDCGGPDCPECEEFLTANIGGSQFVDQAFFNSQFIDPCITGDVDTLFVPNSFVLGPTQGQFTGTAYRVLTGVQQIETQNGTYERKLEIVMPRPNDIMPLVTFDVDDYALGILVPPSVQYTEGFLDGPFAGMTTYQSLAFDDDAYLDTDPMERQFQLLTKVEILPEGYAYLTGTINFVRVEQQFGITDDEYAISNIQFAVQYNYYE
jgi:hypothetical protein